MRRFESFFKIVLVAAVLLIAAGTPVVAKPATKEDTRVVRVEKKRSFFSAWFQSVRMKITRYAMAAN